MKDVQHLTSIILAAGQGTRMKSDLPKVLHKIAGKSMLGHVVDTARALKASKSIVVYGHGGDLVKQSLAHVEDIYWIEQKERLGTGHAVQQTVNEIEDNSICIIMYGDVPLLKIETLAELANKAQQSLSLLTIHLDNPHGYGRIVRDKSGNVEAIIEEKDASAEIRKISEVNTGILAAPGKQLKHWLMKIDNNNAQGEYYLTDIISLAVNDNYPIEVTHPVSSDEVLGVNSKSQLAYLERVYQREQAEKLMEQGVILVDPDRFDARGELEIGQDTQIDINCVLQGKVTIGRNVTIGPNCFIKDAIIEDNVEIKAMTVIEPGRNRH